MKIGIASDHGGIELKASLIKSLERKGYKVTDYGPYTPERCDYPDYAYKVAKEVSRKKIDKGILICKSGIGMDIVANKVSGVRAVCVLSKEQALLSRQHNDTNVITFGAHFISPKRAGSLLTIWLKTKFEGGRHAKRVKKIEKYGNRKR